MNYGMYISAAGAQAQSQRVEVLSNNIANVDTPGFRRELAVLQARSAEAVERNLLPRNSRSREDVGGGVQMQQTLVDQSQGAFRQTDVPTHVAIDGEGFFKVQHEGNQYLTRAGNFMLRNGQLTTASGDPVLSESGSPITIDPTRPFAISTQGEVRQEGTTTPLAIVRPQSGGDLVKVGENLFSPLADAVPVPVEARHVAAGYVEQSSVKPTLEMIELIEASRAFETNARMIQSQDQLAGSLINRLLRAS